MTDGTPETPETPETEAETPEVPEIDPPKIDMDAVAAANSAHDEHVTTARLNLATRLEAAYAEFKIELDRAYQVWDNAFQAAKSAAGIVAHSGDSDAGNTDATTAR